MANLCRGGTSGRSFVGLARSEQFAPAFKLPGCQVQVWRGIGTSILPIRFGARPQITMFTLRYHGQHQYLWPCSKMTLQTSQLTESKKAKIARLPQRLDELLDESPRMDDEVNAVERDLRAILARWSERGE